MHGDMVVEYGYGDGTYMVWYDIHTRDNPSFAHHYSNEQRPSNVDKQRSFYECNHYYRDIQPRVLSLRVLQHRDMDANLQCH